MLTGVFFHLKLFTAGAWVFGQCGTGMESFDDGVSARGFRIMSSDEV